MNRRHALIGLAAVLPLAACTSNRVPVPTDSDAVFRDIDAAIATASVLVDAAEGWGVPPDIIAGARALITKAKAYEAQARAALGTGAWKDLADLALRVLTGIVFAPAPAAPATAPGTPAAPALTMTLRHSA